MHVDTSTGTIEGADEGDVKVFKGIPYARPPLGELRLRSPQPLEPWRACARERVRVVGVTEPAGFDVVGGFPGEQGEDCLTFNVWTAEPRSGPGPSWCGSTGAASCVERGIDLYDGVPGARGDVVVVTVNYRLGALGFLAHPGAGRPDAGGAIGNWGLLDQVAALGWVRDDIARLRRRPENVTIFGESAAACRWRLCWPCRTGLFHRAIVQSGPPRAMPAERAEEIAAKLLAELGVGTVADLRRVPVTC